MPRAACHLAPPIGSSESGRQASTLARHRYSWTTGNHGREPSTGHPDSWQARPSLAGIRSEPVRSPLLLQGLDDRLSEVLACLHVHTGETRHQLPIVAAHLTPLPTRGTLLRRARPARRRLHRAALESL